MSKVRSLIFDNRRKPELIWEIEAENFSCAGKIASKLFSGDDWDFDIRHSFTGIIGYKFFFMDKDWYNTHRVWMKYFGICFHIVLNILGANISI